MSPRYSLPTCRHSFDSMLLTFMTKAKSKTITSTKRLKKICFRLKRDNSTTSPISVHSPWALQLCLRPQRGVCLLRVHAGHMLPPPRPGTHLSQGSPATVASSPCREKKVPTGLASPVFKSMCRQDDAHLPS